MSALRSLGTLVRQAGQAFESFGAYLQGSGPELVSKHQTLQAFQQGRPSLGPATFVAPSASLIGKVTLGRGSSVWYNAVLRGDVNEISVGDFSNLQDGVIVHVAKNNAAGASLPTKIGSYVTIGHGATIHAATIEDGALVGMGATVLDGAIVQKGSILAAGSTLTPKKTVPSGEIWAGNPAKFLRELDEEEANFILQSANNYTALAAVHAAENSKTFTEIEIDKERRRDRDLRDPDYDSHLGVERDPVTREVLRESQST